MKPTLNSPDELTSDPWYPSLKAHVIQSTGLTYYSDKDDDLSRRILGRFARLGDHNCASYLEVLRDPLEGHAELDELIAEITIGETYFFRHQEHFDALRDVVLPDLLERNQAERSLRIWCAGCADGPEAYSLAILLQREMASKLAGWKVSILGTDINRRSLARARDGRFEEWAFRGTNEDLRRDCFVKQGKAWQIAPQYKEGISFQYHNLVEDPIPSLVNNLSAFDLIICRNVMIYFGPDLMDKMIQQFHACLVENAWLLVGPTEPNMTSFQSFCAVNAPGVTIYRKARRSIPVAPVVVPVSAPPQPTAPAVVRSRPVEKVPASKRSVARTLADVRFQADQGEWTKALECCEELLGTDGLNSLVHFYHALVLEHMGRHKEAELALKRAIYLDRQSALPHYYLGLLLQSQGEPRQASRSFENTVELLKSHSDDDVFADADGITAAEMKKLAKMHLEVLQVRA